MSSCYKDLFNIRLAQIMFLVIEACLAVSVFDAMIYVLEILSLHVTVPESIRSAIYCKTELYVVNKVVLVILCEPTLVSGLLKPVGCLRYT